MLTWGKRERSAINTLPIININEVHPDCFILYTDLSFLRIFNFHIFPLQNLYSKSLSDSTHTPLQNNIVCAVMLYQIMQVQYQYPVYFKQNKQKKIFFPLQNLLIIRVDFKVSSLEQNEIVCTYILLASIK